jgi:BirA family biotin operon repressor/biotin-[acetyl-CoA-carboxylase] ligase
VPALEAWERLGSTNDRIRELGRLGAAPFTVVVAEEQTAGRGRGRRSWDSPPGMGLWMSVLLRAGSPAAVPLIPLLVGLAACRAVEREARGVEARLKWPNDVLVEGRKVAGVLCEGTGEGTLVAGVGLNVRQREEDFPPDLRSCAVSLEAASGRAVSRAALAGALLGEMRSLLSRPVLRLEGDLAVEVARRDALSGRTVALEGGVRGRVLGIDPRGRLEVEAAPGEVRPVVAGSVVVLPDPVRPGPASGP